MRVFTRIEVEGRVKAQRAAGALIRAEQRFEITPSGKGDEVYSFRVRGEYPTRIIERYR